MSTPVNIVTPLGLKEIRDKAKKPENIWFRIFYYVSAFIVWLSLRLRVTPNQLTVAGFVVNLVGFVFFLSSKSGSPQIFIAAALFATAHLFDCADGHLAFVSNRRSERGYWLDSTFDVFKLAFVTICFIKLILAPVPPSSAFSGILRLLALAAAQGVLVNYAIALHGTKYAKPGNFYLATQLSSIRAARSVLVRFFVSHIREYGNFLLIFVLFGVNRNLALLLFTFYGFCHFMLALGRVERIARGL